MFLDNFPIIDYDNGQTRNILNRVKLLNVTSSSKSFFQNYTILDGESPEMVAYNFYGDAKFFWLVLIANEIFDMFSEWPMTDRELHEYCVLAEIDEYEIHHYEDGIGMEYEQQDGANSLNPITNFEELDAKNELKRSIKIIKNVYKAQIEKEIREIVAIV